VVLFSQKRYEFSIDSYFNTAPTPSYGLTGGSGVEEIEC